MNILITWASFADLKYYVRNEESVKFSTIAKGLKGLSNKKFDKVMILCDFDKNKNFADFLTYADYEVRKKFDGLIYHCETIERSSNEILKNKDRTKIDFLPFVYYALYSRALEKYCGALLNEPPIVTYENSGVLNSQEGNDSYHHDIMKNNPENGNNFEEVSGSSNTTNELKKIEINNDSFDRNTKPRFEVVEIRENKIAKGNDIIVELLTSDSRGANSIFCYLDYTSTDKEISTLTEYYLKSTKRKYLYRSILNEGVYFSDQGSLTKNQRINNKEYNFIHSLEKEFRALNNIPPTFSHIITKNSNLRMIIRDCFHAAKTEDPILLLGDTGTGKELFAKGIHNSSSRANSNFVAINCGAIPKDLIDSTLFGYKKGSHSLANKDEPGLLEFVADGTLFLDEIGELPFEVQSKLLRVLQEKEFNPIGGKNSISFKARIISATNVDLIRKLDNTFRSDLYYRMNTYVFRIPPLKDRGKEDIEELIEYFIDRYSMSEEYHFKKILIEDDAMKYLVDYDWPGNVRQLEAVLKRVYRNAINKNTDIDLSLVIASMDDARISGQESSYVLRNTYSTIKNEFTHSDLNKVHIRDNFKLNNFLKDVEKNYIKEALSISKSQATAGKLLGLSPTTLGNRMKALGIPKKKS